jgi:hypothetical protein
MTWRPLALPEPLESAGPASGTTTHGCGPLGCVLAGWIRVGWGAEDSATSNHIATPETHTLRCELSTAKDAPASNDTTGASARYNEYGYYGRYGRYGGYTPQTQDWQPFFSIEAPKLVTDDLGWSRPVDDVYDRSGNDRSNTGNLSVSRAARVYAWGQKGIEWDIHGRYMVRFTSPFESSSVLRATQTTAIPRYIADATNFLGLGGGITHPVSHIGMIPGDDAAHALLVFHRNWYSSGGANNDAVVVELEADRPAIEVHRADAQPLGEIESAVRMGGRWYVATTEPLATAIWELENGSAREVTRVPRAANEGNARSVALRLAKRADGHMIAAIVDGTPMTEGAARPSQWINQTWALPIDVDSGMQHEPERLGLANGSGKHVHVCGPQDGGWVVDGRWPGGALIVSTASGTQLHGSAATGLFARYRITSDSLCVEKLSFMGYGDAASAGTLGKAVEGPFVEAGVFLERARQAFRCVGNR